jgi:hypothetical protein
MSDPMALVCAKNVRRWLGTMAICAALSAGCGGMDKLNDLNDNGIPDDQEQLEDEDDDTDEEHVDVAVVEECPQLCAAAIVEMGDAPGCTIDCGVDILASFEGVAGVNVAILLSAGAAGDFEAGQSCDLVTVCETACGQMLGDCMDALPQPPDPVLLGLCTGEYRECLIEENCFISRMECESDASILMQACIDAGDPIEDCQEILEDAMCACGTIYNACVGSDAEACPEDEALALIAPPMPTGPGRFRVTRGFIDRELDRLTAMSTEIFVMPAFDHNDKPVGFELRSIRNDDSIYALGLRNRDVLIAINDKPLVKVGAVENLLNLYKASQLRLTIRRSGLTRQLTYDIVQK